MTTPIAALGLLDEEDIVLDAAALSIAALDHPDIDLDPYLALLDSLGRRLASVAPGIVSGELQAGLLADVLAGEYGFAGDRETYDDPDNADMIRVIERRRGLPVSLSILYVAAARRVGWSADALNTPGHVLVAVGPETGRVLIDPFNEGVAVPPTRLAALVAQVLGPGAVATPEHVRPMGNRAVLVRLILNQATRAEQAGDAARAMTLYARMTEVAPDAGQGWWELARLQLGAGDVAAARASLSAMLEITRDAERRTMIATALDALSGRPAEP